MPGKFTFFSNQLANNTLVFDENETRHAIGTLRYKEGDEIEVTDGQGNYFEAKINAVTKKNFAAEIISQKQVDRDGLFSIAVGIIKSTDRMEWIVEKCTELGVAEIIFFEAQNSERNRLNLERMEKIAVAALKQSHGAWLPKISFMKWKELVAKNADFKMVAFVENGNEKVFNPLKSNTQSTLLSIGPEGDFAAREMEEAQAAGFEKVHLGKTVLRTETAVVAAASVYHLK